jgi:GTP cyclohydrolase I
MNAAVQTVPHLITCKFNGRFETDSELQRRFMDLARAQGNGR